MMLTLDNYLGEETMKKVMKRRFGKNADRNYKAAKEAYDLVKKVRG